MRKPLLFLLLYSIATALCLAQEKPTLSYYLPAGQNYDPAIPKPADVLGYEVGVWHATHDQLLLYARAVAAASPRITIAEQGRSHENRPTVLLTITAPENHSKLEQIRQEHLKLSNPSASAGLNTAQMPVVVWMGYSVHGNEPSGGNAALLVMYHLAASRSAETEKTLRESVILLDPCLNPDGFQRFSTWVNSHKSLQVVSDPNAREFGEPWPGGRTNHYWFDLNRDWLVIQHPESRARIVSYQNWRPNVLTDYHEMGTNSTYFFQPGIPSRKNPFTPDKNLELTAKIGNFHGKALDSIGSLYYTKESFDDFYIGKGSTYPDVQGCVGILFEQASSRGHAQDSRYGVVTFPFTIRNQFVTSLSSLSASINMRTELLNYQREFYQQANEKAAKDPVKAYVFGQSEDPARNYHLLDILLAHKVEVYELAQDMTQNGISFRKGSSYVVPLNQPQHALIKASFSTQTRFTDSLFYDISTWTLPLAFNLPYAEVTGRPLAPGAMGAKVEKAAFPTGKFSGGKSAVGYAFTWNGYYAPRALYRLQKAGIFTQVVNASFATRLADGTSQQFAPGTILIPIGLQPARAEQIYTLLQQIAAQDGIDVFSLNSGLSESGIDLGSPSADPLVMPRVLVAVGSGISNSEAGEIWHLFDQRYHIPVSMVEASSLNNISLEKYNVIILPGGSYTSIGNSGKENLKSWLRQGNTLIAMKGAASWASSNEMGDLKAKRSASSDSAAIRPYAYLEADLGSRRIGGSIFSARLDTTHPIGYGYQQGTIPVFRTSTTFMEPRKNPYANPLVYTASPLMSGYVAAADLKIAPGSAGISVIAQGRGRVISIQEELNFRAFWFGTNKLFANAVFFGQVIDARSAR